MIYTPDIMRHATALPPELAESVLSQCQQHQVINSLCGDRLVWYAQIEHSIFRILFYKTSSCLLCKAACNLCFERFNQHSLSSLDEFIETHQLNTNQISFNQELQLFSQLQQSQNRQKCVSLPFLGLQQLAHQIG